MAKALVTGSFDPVTLGHMDLISRASKIFDRVTVGIFVNSTKSYMFSAEDRAAMIEEACAEAGLSNVAVELCTGMVAHYVRDNGIDAIVKGIRGAADAEYERMIDEANKLVYPGAETMLLISNPRYGAVSSTVVREFIRYGEDISALVPSSVLRRISREN